MKKIIMYVILVMAVSLTGCDKKGIGSDSETLISELPGNSDNDLETQPSAAWSNDAVMKDLYAAAPYSASYSELIDTYLIACGLYYNFESPYLFPSDVNIDYNETIEYFSAYKEHAFIQGLGAYVDEQSGDASMNVYVPLLQYVVSMKEEGECMGNIQSYTFQTDEAFYHFLNSLNQFYIDTEAAAFFDRSSIHRQLEEYIQSGMENISVLTYFNAIESYTGTKDRIFPETNLYYATCLSVYKSRNNASFHYVFANEDTYLLSFQSPLGHNGNFDFEDMLDTTIHESLHPFINPGVEHLQEMIQLLAADKNPADYTSAIYVNMPWYRITDEAVVRAVQARIYREAGQGDETLARQLLDREGSTANLEAMYDSLAEYEGNRDQYPEIDDYLEILITLYLES